jgi:3'(2'), 5'-bisphosphate nucleotidase/inositol polyphosphate 1-phosphatase
MDSQAKYGALAQGDGAIYLRFSQRGYIETVWDHAAGSIIVTGVIHNYVMIKN